MPPKAVDPDLISQFAESLRAGAVVAFPTETVYGLGACISQEHAVRRIYDLKQRPLSQPLLAHVNSIAMARSLAASWPDRAETLAAKFWPGPLTIILPKAHHVPDVVTGGGPTIGLRCPDHPVALELIGALGEAIAGTSANRSGETSPTKPEHVRRSFPADVVDVLDAGAAPGGLESTVLLLGARPENDRILRPGPITAAQLGISDQTNIDAKPSRGTSGRFQLILDDDVEDCVALPGAVLVTHHPVDLDGVEAILLPSTAADYGREMYAAIFEAESKRIEPGPIFVVEPSETGELWDAIRQRLRRLSENI